MNIYINKRKHYGLAVCGVLLCCPKLSISIGVPTLGSLCVEKLILDGQVPLQDQKELSEILEENNLDPNLFNFSDRPIKNKNSSGKCLKKFDFSDCRLKNVNLNGCDLTETNLDGALFENDVTLDDAILYRSEGSGIFKFPENFSHTKLIRLYPELVSQGDMGKAEGLSKILGCLKLKLEGSKFQDLNLTGIKLTHADLENVTFDHCDLTHADFKCSIFKNTIFEYNISLNDLQLDNRLIRINNNQPMLHGGILGINNNLVIETLKGVGVVSIIVGVLWLDTALGSQSEFPFNLDIKSLEGIDFSQCILNKSK